MNIYIYRTPENRLVLVGPYAEEHEAAAHFQRLYHTRASAPEKVRPWEPLPEE